MKGKTDEREAVGVLVKVCLSCLRVKMEQRMHQGRVSSSEDTGKQAKN